MATQAVRIHLRRPEIDPGGIDRVLKKLGVELPGFAGFAAADVARRLRHGEASNLGDVMRAAPDNLAAETRAVDVPPQKDIDDLAPSLTEIDDAAAGVGLSRDDFHSAAVAVVAAEYAETLSDGSGSRT